MAEERDQRNVEGVNTADQPAEGGPYVEGPVSGQPVEHREPTENRPAEKRTSVNDNREDLVPLFEHDATENFQKRWLEIQSKFVDDPSDSVKQADQLVSDVIQDITRNFADRRGTLEKQWNGGEEASTEDLRIALKQYRSFFDRLLTLES
jgi:hypothetical protein